MGEGERGWRGSGRDSGEEAYAVAAERESGKSFRKAQEHVGFSRNVVTLPGFSLSVQRRKHMARDTHRVMPHKDGWQVKRDGDQRASRVAPTKAEAERKGREISRNQETEFQVHNRDGKIGSSDSYGNDPRGRG